ncbi:MAG: hypothetical protein J0L93_00320 [Deltaproteobacteria bacterium]|nr:hypothetical protein [Deltaproteobacteria bacterium]
MKSFTYGILVASALQIFGFTTAALGGDHQGPTSPPVEMTPPPTIDSASIAEAKPVRMNLSGVNYTCTPELQEDLDWSQLFPDLRSNP